MILDSTNTVARRCTTEERRRRAVEIARETFFKRGYGATTMSEIAALAGGSKTTLWSIFPSKEDLFAAVCDDLIERYGCAITVEIDPAAPIAEQLHRFGKALLDTVLSPPMIDLQRMVIGEAARFPEMARLFFERGPARGKARLAGLLETAMERGVIATGDPRLAAGQFVGLLQAGSWHQMLLGVSGCQPAERQRGEIELAVTTFLRCWAVSQAGHSLPASRHA